MKNLLALLIPVSLMLASCGDPTAAYKASIDALATSWDSTTAVVSGFAGKLQEETTGMTNALAGMVVAEGAKMDEAATAKVAELQANGKAQVDAVSALSAEVATFVSQWGEKATQLASLKDGLAAGKLEGDVEGTIAALTTAVAEGGTKVTEWTGKLDAAKAAFAEVVNQFTAMTAAPAEEAKK